MNQPITEKMNNSTDIRKEQFMNRKQAIMAHRQMYV